EEVCAIVVRNATVACSADELIEWSKQHLARYKYPRRIEFVDALPLGPSGKILKRTLVERFSA
ncbi:MAG: long-chain fatty acid--CoA ligase, partial [Candidatus Eremiobacteraeota bacterium]|nr:long-chain fatty acid--CoA ligase [Candidatus Eremiobacteraeota bacterium]